MIKKHFLTFGEATQVLGVSKEALRQSIEFDLWKKLPLITFERSGGWLVTFNGRGVKSSAADIHDAGTYKVELPNGKVIQSWEWHGLDDNYCDIDDSDTPQSQTGFPATFIAKGYFRLMPGSVRAAAQDGYIGGHERIAPIGWWNDERIPKDHEGSPLIWLTIIPTNDIRFSETHRAIDDLFLMERDVVALHSGHSESASASVNVTGKPLEARERNNLLRIIAALAKEAGIDIGEGKGGAATIDAAVAAAGYDGPKERTVRDILKQVREVG